jgi:hypothetical protein
MELFRTVMTLVALACVFALPFALVVLIARTAREQ